MARGMTAPKPIAIVHDLEEIAEAMHRWCAQHGITRRELDQRAGLADGHSGKLLGRRRTARLGNTSLRWSLAALGLQLALQIDPSADVPPDACVDACEQNPHPHWRDARDSKWGRRLAAKRAQSLTDDQRRDIARRAARARWQRRQTPPTTS